MISTKKCQSSALAKKHVFLWIFPSGERCRDAGIFYNKITTKTKHKIYTEIVLCVRSTRDFMNKIESTSTGIQWRS